MDATLIANPVIRLLVVDDHPVVREGLASMVDGEPDMKTVAQAGDGREAIAMYREHRPDVTLMDSQMPDMDGTAATAAIRAEWPDARIVMITTFRGDAQALRALKAGVSGYLLKSTVLTSMLEAIRTVHRGRRFVSPEVASELALHMTEDALSPREVEVLTCVATGGSNRTIATRLGVSEDTVKSHVKHIMSKLSATDRTHAVAIALKRRIIEV